MTPFEPKTDSKEFETTDVPANRRAESEAADLTIRIWRQDRSGSTAALAWNSESVLVYMIADLVAASHGRTAVETPDVMSAHFDNSLQALVGAKRIQTAILEFLSYRPGDCLGAAILIHPPMAGGFSQVMAQSALRLAEPGQIMLSHEVARRFQDLPGIELRAVPALTTGGSEHAGLMELLWTSAERLASLRSTAPAAPTANMSPTFGATMIVNTPVAASIDTASRKTGDESPAQRGAALDEGLAEFEDRRSFITKSRIAVGAIAVVLVVAGLALFHPWSSSNLQPNPQRYETPTAERPATATEPPASVPLPPPVVQPQGSRLKPRPPAVKPPVNTKPPVVAKDTDKDKVNKPPDTPIQGFEGNSTYDGMTQKDIPRLLQWARSDAGNGNYAKAAQEYRVILQLQPNNPDAKEGLRKIQVAQGRDQ